MDELCGGLCALAVVLGVVTVAGHGIWVLIARVFTALSGAPARAREEASIECPGCGYASPAWSPRCLTCGLDRQSKVGQEVADIAAALRQLDRWRGRPVLDRTLADQLEQALRTEKQQLLTEGKPRKQLVETPKRLDDAPAPAFVPPTVALTGLVTPPPPERKPWQRLEDLLAPCNDVQGLPLEDRDQALVWYRQADGVQLAALSANAQRNLAVLLENLQHIDDALRTYRRLLQRHAQVPDFAILGLHAGRLAHRANAPGQMEWFLKRALAAGVLSPDDEQTARSLLQEVEAPPVDVLEVLPVVEAPQSAVSTLSAPVAAAPVPVEPVVVAPPPEPPPPRRPFTEVLAAFMEDKNIFWGEILGGLLIVGCSIALVISLWSQVEKIPYFPFVIFGTITAALYGAGLYTQHHWKLEATSRGLLAIATLLVPLNFLVIAGLHRDPSGRLGDLLIELGITGVFGAIFVGLMASAGKVLFPEGRWLFVLGVLGTSACQLLVAPFVQPGEVPALGTFLLLGLLPTLCQVVSTGWALRLHETNTKLDEFQTKSLFGFLGIATFALAVTLGFLAFRSGDLPLGLQRLALLIAAAGWPFVAGGLRVQRSEDLSAGLRTTGTVLSLVGMLLLVVALACAWPEPLAVILVGALNFALLTTVGFRRDVPYAHAIALPCLVLAYLTAFHGLVGEYEIAPDAWQLALILFSSRSGTALAVLVVGMGLTAQALATIGQRRHAAIYALGAGSAALVSLAMVTVNGPDDSLRALIIYAIYGAGSLALNLHWRRASVSYLGLALLLGATLWGLHWQEPDRLPIWAAVLATEALGLAYLRARGSRPNDDAVLVEEQELPPLLPLRAFLAEPLGYMAAVTAVLAIVLGCAKGWLGAGSWAEEPEALHAYTAAVLAGTAFLLAWAYRALPLTWCGSALLLGGLLHALAWEADEARWLRSFVPMALLAHATLTGLASLGVRRFAPRQTNGTSQLLTALFGEPLTHSALLTSLIALGYLLFPEQGHMVRYSVAMTWLAGCWLVVALLQGWPRLFAAFQATLAMALVYGITAWLEGQNWFGPSYLQGLIDPRSCQAYGLGLAVLSLGWTAVRVALRGQPAAQQMLNPGWPMTDQLVLAGVVVLQLLIAIHGLQPILAHELTPDRLLAVDAAAALRPSFASPAWWLLGILTGALVAGLWEGAWTVRKLGLALLALTVPVLLAGRFESDWATAATLRWGLAGCFFACSVLLWLRDPLSRLAERLSMPSDPEEEAGPQLRLGLIGLCMVPIVALTVADLLIQLIDGRLKSPVESSFFYPLDNLGRHGIPLLVLALTLVGHSLRERSAGYAFAAGLLIDATAIGGYAMHAFKVQHRFGEAETVFLLQLGTSLAAVWALFWLASQRWLAAWREDTPRGSRLMNAQLGLTGFGNVWLLAGGVAALVAWFPARAPADGSPIYLAAPWAAAVGSSFGLLTLALAVGALAYRSWKRAMLPEMGIRVGVGLAVAALLACSVERATTPGWGYRTLMLGWALFAVVLALARRTRSAPNQTVAAGVLSAALFVLFLGLKAAIWHQDHLWAAGAIFLASVASAGMAVARREETWAFTAGLGLNVAASLLIWHYFRLDPFASWWHYALQANSAAAGLAALLWLAARKHFYGETELRITTAPLLLVQVILGIVGNLPTLGLAFLTFLVLPDPGGWMMSFLAELGKAGGFLALVLPMSAVLWYATQVTPRARLPLTILFGLALGVLGACTIAEWDTTGDLYSFHFLMIAWSTVGLLTLGLGLVTVALQLAQHQETEQGTITEPGLPPWIVRWLSFPTQQIQRWVEVTGWLVVLLALRLVGDTRGGAFWSPAGALTVVFMNVGLGLWARKPRYVWQSGALLNLAGNLYLLAYGPVTLINFMAVNVACLALGSVFWSALELALKTNALAFHLRGRLFGFHHVAAFLGLIGLTTLTTALITAVPLEATFEPAGGFTWMALLATGLALLLSLWDAEAPLGLGSLYLVGLQAVVLFLHGQHIALVPLQSTAALALAGYVLATALLTIAWTQMELGSLLRLPRAFGEMELAGLFRWQLATGVLVALRSVTTAIDLGQPEQRLLGPLMSVLLVPVGVVLTRFQLRHGRYLTLGVTILTLGELGWAFLPAELPAPWLHRHVVMMAALTLAASVCTSGRRWLPDDWAAAARQLAPWCGGLAGLALLFVLGEEAYQYNPEFKKAPTQFWAALLVIAALLGLIGAALRFALRPERDPLQLSEERRTAYVYTAEVLVVLLFTHIRLTMPELFSARMAQYWTFIIMAIAFGGVGLGEFCRRRNLTVLAGPLQRTAIFLPIIPLLALWLKMPAGALSAVVEPHVPGTKPLFGYFSALPYEWNKYALLWFLTALLYSLVSLAHRSFRFAVLAALAANFALWSYWQHADLFFFQHPQLWLIPLGLIVLAAEHLNRDKLDDNQRRTLRYVGLGLIYLSSTADLFIAGLGSLWVSLALMVLSIVGVLTGIVLRVRAYLFLGFGFLFLVLFSMIWHAAVDLAHTWVWWAFGIVLGVAILSLFAVFEKRRNDVLQMVEQFKQWR